MAVQFDLSGFCSAVAGKRVAVACTPAAWLPGIGAFADYVTHAANVRGFLALEHGLRGELQDGVLFDSYTDPATGCEVFSFYGQTHTFPEPFLEDIDVVVFQAQDVSHRAYTYKIALADTLVACARTNTTVLVVDRPSPLAHLGCSGLMAHQFFPLPLPMLLPLTLGELGLWLHRAMRLDVELHVLPALGWKRRMTWPETGLPWIPPSPNIPTLASTYCYAMTGILQATNVSEGRGTCKPFEYFGAPFLDAQRLAERLQAHRLPGIIFREVHFQPAFNRYAGDVCHGLHLMVTAPRRLDPIRTLFAILHELAKLHPNRFALLPGFKVWLDDGEWTIAHLSALDPEQMADRAATAGAAFLAEARDVLLPEYGQP